MLIEFHRNMLGDQVRNDAFYRALQQTIQPGKTTLADLGSGTGLLAFLAIKLGAKACYLYEYSAALKLSQKLAKQNGIRHCHFIHQHSATITNPVPVDVIVSETLGNYAFEENIIESLEDAKRFLKPGGIIIPQRIEQFIAPIIAEHFHGEICSWNDVGYDLDFALAKEASLNNLYVRTISPKDLLQTDKAIQRWDNVDFRHRNGSVRKGRASWRLETDTTIYGFAIWWSCELVDKIQLSTSPWAPRTHWEQLYFPVRTPLQVMAGDSLQITLHSDSRYEVGVNLRWEVGVSAPSGVPRQPIQKLDMRKGNIE